MHLIPKNLFGKFNKAAYDEEDILGGAAAAKVRNREIEALKEGTGGGVIPELFKRFIQDVAGV